ILTAALERMELISEAGQIAPHLTTLEEPNEFLPSAFQVAALTGQRELALKLGIMSIHTPSFYSEWNARSAGRVIRYCLKEGLFDEARGLLQELEGGPRRHLL